MTDPLTEDPADRATNDEPVNDPRDADEADEPGGRGFTPPHPSPADGGETGGSVRPPRPSQAEGDRED